MKFSAKTKKWLAVPLSLALLIPTAGSMVSAAQDGEMPSVTTPAVELRTTLDRYLGEHAYLAIETMRKGAEGAADFEQAAAALSANTTDLAGAIASVYGEEAGTQFEEMWSRHIGFFVDYVTATAEEDQVAKEEALANLDNYREEFSNFLATATGERLEAGALAEGLQMHVDQLIGAFDAFVAEDFDKAYEYGRKAISHIYGVSDGLSNAIVDQFPDKFENTTADTPAADLRSNLNYLLTEHAGLAVTAMQNGIDGSADFEASANALAANTTDLSAAIASVYGEEAGTQFEEMWAAHIGNFVEYVTATGAEDEEAKTAAIEALNNYRAEFSAFIETATEGRVVAEDLSEGLQMHVNQLVTAFDSYVVEDYATAYENVRTAYAHMLNPSKGLSAAFVDQFPENFVATKMPTEMPKTGLGGTAQDESFAWVWVSLAALLAAAGVFALKRVTGKSE